MISWSMGGIWQWFLIRFIWYRGLCELWQVLELQCCSSAIDLRLSRRRKKRSEKNQGRVWGNLPPIPTKHGCFVLRPLKYVWKKSSCFKSWSFRSRRTLHMTLEVGFVCCCFTFRPLRQSLRRCPKLNRLILYRMFAVPFKEVKRVLHFYTDTSTRFFVHISCILLYFQV